MAGRATFSGTGWERSARIRLAIAPLIAPPSLPTAMNGSLYGTGIPAERPFRSLSYPDINYTIMRPAALPPSPYTDPIWQSCGDDDGDRASPRTTRVTRVCGTQRYSWGTRRARTQERSTGWDGRVGVDAPYDPVYPPAIPVRRLFQVPDSLQGGHGGALRGWGRRR